MFGDLPQVPRARKKEINIYLQGKLNFLLLVLILTFTTRFQRVIRTFWKMAAGGHNSDRRVRPMNLQETHTQDGNPALIHVIY